MQGVINTADFLSTMTPSIQFLFARELVKKRLIHFQTLRITFPDLDSRVELVGNRFEAIMVVTKPVDIKTT